MVCPPQHMSSRCQEGGGKRRILRTTLSYHQRFFRKLHIEAFIADQRRDWEHVQLGVLHATHCSGLILHAQPGAWSPQRVGPFVSAYKHVVKFIISRKKISLLEK